MPGATRPFTYSSVSPHHKLALAWASLLKKENVWSESYWFTWGIPAVTGTKSYSVVRLKEINPWSFSILQVMKAFLDQRYPNKRQRAWGVPTRTFWPHTLQANCDAERSPCSKSIFTVLIMQDCSGLFRYVRDGERLEAVALKVCQTFVRVYASAVWLVKISMQRLEFT